MTFDLQAICPSCHAIDSIDIGPIPDSSGPGLGAKRLTPGGHLYRCRGCELFFKFPRLSSSELEECYRAADEPRWEWKFSERHDWQLALDRIRAEHPAAQVLDIGCNDGVFLHGLGPGFGRYGIELNPAAAEKAATKGAVVLGQDVFGDLPAVKLKFDVITAFDVIEHVEEPVRFLGILADKLKPGGDIIISTGNTSAKAWRFLGSRYWYCWYPEHIVFINPAWATGAADKLGLSLIEAAAFSYGDALGLNRWRELVHNVIYRFFPAPLAWMRRRISVDPAVRQHRELSFQPPGWSTAQDHMLFRFRKNDQ